MDRELLVKDVAVWVGVDTSTVTNWELGHSEPALEHWPAIIRFLGYAPLPHPKSFADRLRAYRVVTGRSQRSLAKKIGVDPSTLADWESGRRAPYRHLKEQAERVIEPVLMSCSWR